MGPKFWGKSHQSTTKVTLTRHQPGSKGSECISILGFRVPTTCGGKNFNDHISCLCSEEGAKGSEGMEQGAKGSKGSECISILGFRVPTTCGGENFDDHI